MTPAPLYTDIADGPSGGQAFWLTAEDGVRLRAAIWPGGSKGTVFLLPGRTEYIEKYGRAAGDLAARGFATATNLAISGPNSFSISSIVASVSSTVS